MMKGSRRRKWRKEDDELKAKYRGMYNDKLRQPFKLSQQLANTLSLSNAMYICILLKVHSQCILCHFLVYTEISDAIKVCLFTCWANSGSSVTHNFGITTKDIILFLVIVTFSLGCKKADVCMLFQLEFQLCFLSIKQKQSFNSCK